MVLQDNQPAQVGVTVVLFALSFLVVAARVYIRSTRKTWGMDDSFIVVGMVFFVFQCVTTIGSAINGIGLKTEHITSNNEYIQGGKWFYLYNIAYTLAATCIRLSVLQTLLRIVIKRSYKISIYIVAALVTAIGLQNIIFLLVQCKPIAWYWDKTIQPPGACFRGPVISANTITVNFVAAATDIFSSILPIVIVWNIKMNIRSKISVCLILGLGIFASICIIVRLPITMNLQYHEESFYSVSVTVIWAAAEAGIGIIATSLSALRPLFSRFIGSTVDRSNTGRSFSYAKNRGTMHSGRFRSNGITKLSERGEHEAWGAKGGQGEDMMDKKDYELESMRPKTFVSKTVVSGGGPNSYRADTTNDLSGDATGDANSETEILDEQRRQQHGGGINMVKSFTVEVTREIP